MKRKDTDDVAGHGYYGHNTAPKSVSCDVGPVVAHDNPGPALVGFTASRRLEVDQTYLTAMHRRARRQPWLPTTPDRPTTPIHPKPTRNPVRDRRDEAGGSPAGGPRNVTGDLRCGRTRQGWLRLPPAGSHLVSYCDATQVALATARQPNVPKSDPLAKTNDLGHVLPTSRPAYRDRVADWTGVGRNTADLYLGMAVHELHGVSPSYEALCRAVAGSQPTCALLDKLPQAKRQPNLLLGAVRFLAGPVDDPVAFLNFVTARWGAVADTMMAHRTQTNEPGRCATLLPLLARVEGGARSLHPDCLQVTEPKAATREPSSAGDRYVWPSVVQAVGRASRGVGEL